MSFEPKVQILTILVTSTTIHKVELFVTDILFCMYTKGVNTYCDFSVHPPVWCASGTQVHTSHVTGHFCPVLFGPGCQRTAVQTAVKRGKTISNVFY